MLSNEQPGFVEKASFRPEERAVVWTIWVPDPNGSRARWRWTSPSGAQSWTSADLPGVATVSYSPYPGNLPMEPAAGASK